MYLPITGMLREPRLEPPSNNCGSRVIVEYLDISLAHGGRAIVWNVFSNQIDDHRFGVQLKQEPSGIFSVHFPVGRCIIEQGNARLASPTRVMLPLKIGTVAHCKTRVLATHTPYDVARVTIDVVNSVAMARGDEEIP